MKIPTIVLLLGLITPALGQIPSAPSTQEAIFLDPATFSIEIQAEETGWGQFNNRRDVETNSVHFKIILKNNSTTNFPNLRIDYDEFRDINENGDCYVETTPYQIETEPIAPSETKTIGIRPVRGNKYPLTDSSRLVAGICCRIYLPLANGQEVMREIRSPATRSAEKYPWKAPKNPALTNASTEKEIFLNPNSFEIDMQFYESDWRDTEGSNGHQSKDSHYIISLNNTSTATLAGLRMEYCIYNNSNGNLDKTPHIRTNTYKRAIGDLAPSKKEEIRATGAFNYRHKKQGFLNEVVGARFRFYLPMADGQEVVQEVCWPKNLSKKYEWQKYEERVAISAKPSAPAAPSSPVESAKIRSIQATAYTQFLCEEPRVFKKADGSPSTATLKEFDPATGQVQLLLADGSIQTDPLAVFCESDQQVIHDWYAACYLLKKGRLNITVKENKQTESNCSVDLPNLNQGESWTKPERCDATSYDIILINRGGLPLNDIQVEYCIYHHAKINETILTRRYDVVTHNENGRTTSIDGAWSVIKRDRCPKREAIDAIAGQFIIAELADKNRAQKATDLFITPQSGTQTHGSGEIMHERTIQCNLLGIRYRVYLPTASGGYMMKEFAEPQSLLKETEWDAPSTRKRFEW
jgi:hypothetical protein